MHIEQQHITPTAQELLEQNVLAKEAFDEIKSAICSMVGTINNSEKNCNGVVPVKEPCYKKLEYEYNWFREKPLSVLSKKGGPIDVYKEFKNGKSCFKVAIEFETGNISSAHRSMNKMHLGIINKEIDLAVLMMPMHQLSYYLTDRVSNYEELAPYFPLINKTAFIIIGFDVETYSADVPCLKKGKDGMSTRAKRKWEAAQPKKQRKKNGIKPEVRET